MKNIVLVRVDERLIHGQFVTAWLRQTDASTVFLVDDIVINDEFTKMLYMAAFPKDKKLVISGVEEAISNFATLENEKIILLVRNVECALKLAQQGFAMETIIIGGVGSKSGSKKICRNLYLLQEEIDCVRELISLGIILKYQLVPNDKSVVLSKDKL